MVPCSVSTKDVKFSPVSVRLYVDWVAFLGSEENLKYLKNHHHARTHAESDPPARVNVHVKEYSAIGIFSDSSSSSTLSVRSSTTSGY